MPVPGAARSSNDKLFYTYDVLGRKTALRSGSANGPLLATWVYDTVRKGALTSSTRKGTGPDGNTYDSTIKVNNYDVLGRPRSVTYTIPSVEGVGTSYTFGTNYHLDGTVQSLGMPAAGGLTGEALVFTYDDYRRPTRLTSNLATYVNNTLYTPTGKPLQYELGNTTGKRVWLTTTWQYGTQRLASSRVDREDITGSDRHAVYDYDDAATSPPSPTPLWPALRSSASATTTCAASPTPGARPVAPAPTTPPTPPSGALLPTGSPTPTTSPATAPRRSSTAPVPMAVHYRPPAPTPMPVPVAWTRR